MTIYELMNKHLEKHPNSHFFDNDTLKFFGEALSRMRVLKGTVTIKDYCGKDHVCYVVSATRHKNWNGRCKPYIHYHYFDIDTLDDISI